jgi:alkanesulfonate monooxygenase SsuD/methylene tetrahydromethanopterin reductase-like flavin-dependent oxidoreductase (luciferase family)
MDLALMTEPQIGMTYDEQLDAARWCERHGIGVFARSDHYLSSKPAPHATDAFAALAGLARDTATVELCVLVSPISFRHPAVIAKTAATIDEMSGGRLRLGVGTGWMDLEHDAFGLELWPMAERFARLEESLRYLAAAFGGGTAAYTGAHYAIGGVDVRPKPTGSLPIVVGGTGPRRTPRLAGTYADEYNLFVSPPSQVAIRAERAREAAVAAGRSADAFELTVMGPVVVGADEAAYRRRLEAKAAARDRSPDDQEELYRKMAIPHGPPQQARSMIADLEAVGVGRYYLQTLGTIDYDELEETIEVLG